MCCIIIDRRNNNAAYSIVRLRKKNLKVTINKIVMNFFLAIGT